MPAYKIFYTGTAEQDPAPTVVSYVGVALEYILFTQGVYLKHSVKTFRYRCPTVLPPFGSISAIAQQCHN